MVDTRNLTAHSTAQDGLPHWPAAVAWWHSRLQLVGPMQEKTELLFFPACEQTGLHHVHPTWAGTFALAALVALFPGTNFILLDSDCLPVTLFEAADLWREGYLTRFPPGTGKTLPAKHPLDRKQVYLHDPRVVYTQQPFLPKKRTDWTDLAGESTRKRKEITHKSNFPTLWNEKNCSMEKCKK